MRLLNLCNFSRSDSHPVQPCSPSLRFRWEIYSARFRWSDRVGLVESSQSGPIVRSVVGGSVVGGFIVESVSHLVAYWVGRSLGQSGSRSVGPSLVWSVVGSVCCRSVDRSAGRWFGRSLGRSVGLLSVG